MAKSMSEFDRMQAEVIARALGQTLEEDESQEQKSSELEATKEPKPDQEKPWHERYSEDDIKELERKAKLVKEEGVEKSVDADDQKEEKETVVPETILDMIIKAADAKIQESAKPAESEQGKKSEQNTKDPQSENDYTSIVVEHGKEIVEISRSQGYDPRKILSTIDSLTTQELVGIAAFKLQYEESLSKQKQPETKAKVETKVPIAEIPRADIQTKRADEQPVKKQSVFYKRN